MKLIIQGFGENFRIDIAESIQSYIEQSGASVEIIYVDGIIRNPFFRIEDIQSSEITVAMLAFCFIESYMSKYLIPDGRRSNKPRLSIQCAYSNSECES